MAESPAFDANVADPLLDLVVRSAPIVLFAANADGVLTLSRGKALDAMGLAQGELVGRSVFDLYVDEPHVAEGARAALSGDAVTVPLRLGDVHHETMFAPIHGRDGSVVGLVGVATDVTERVRAQEELQHRLRCDSTTGLPNRQHFIDLVDRAIEDARVAGRAVAVIAVRLVRHREVADAVGHGVAGAAVRDAAERLQSLASPAVVARIDTGRFALLLQSASPSDSTTLARDVVRALRRPFEVQGRRLDMQPVAGVALFPGHAAGGEALLIRAESTLQAAAGSPDGFAIYSSTQVAVQLENVRILGDLQRALEQREVHLHYQPLVDLRTAEVRGVEALARWSHPELGQIAPDRFVALAESSGLIRSVTTYVLEAAAQQAHAWRQAGVPLRVDVNISPHDLVAPEFVNEVESTLGAWGLSTGSMALEVTERAMVEDPRMIAARLRALDEMGVHLALDDFGTGQSNMTALKQLPFHNIKIDQLFVRDVRDDTVDRAIVSSVVSLARVMGRQTTAEGVETPAVWDSLIDLGCDTAQGYHIARPMPGDQILPWLAAGPWSGPTA